MQKRIVVSVLMIMLVFGLNLVTNAGKEFTIGVIPVQTQGKMEVALDQLEAHLEQELGQEVKVEVYPDYNGVVEAMNYGQVDMAYFGPFTYVIAHQRSGAQAIITQLVDGEPFYHSYIITHKDSPLNSLDDLLANGEKMHFAFGDPNSTSGSLIPGLAFQDREFDYESGFKTIRYTGSHDATALAVEYQHVDAGAIDSAIYNILVRNGKINGENFKIIWKSDKLFQYPWAVTKDTSPEMIAKLRAAFFMVDDPEILDAFGASAFVKAEFKDYQPIVDAAKKAGRI